MNHILAILTLPVFTPGDNNASSSRDVLFALFVQAHVGTVWMYLVPATLPTYRYNLV
jgi:hypothetical protein